VTDSVQTSVVLHGPAVAPPEVVPRIGGAGPLWRSLLQPHKGQRAVEFATNGSDLFSSLRQAGVRLERSGGPGELVGTVTFDLVLEDRTVRGAPIRPERVRALLVPGGRWVAVLEKKPWVGLAAGRRPGFLRRKGFENVETFCAYPSLRSPRMLVPLNSPEAFRYFLGLAAGVRGPRQRLLALGARLLCSLRLHRMFLPNLIVVAQRKG